MIANIDERHPTSTRPQAQRRGPAAPRLGAHVERLTGDPAHGRGAPLTACSRLTEQVQRSCATVHKGLRPPVV